MNSVNGVRHKRPGLCQTLWENCHLCSPAVCALILQSASTSAVQKHTVAWNCYKANCSLSIWDFVWPCCVGVCAHTSVCPSSQSLFETSIVKPTLERVCLCVQRVCLCVQHVCLTSTNKWTSSVCAEGHGSCQPVSDFIKFSPGGAMLDHW